MSFAILAQQRSGTHLLATLLNSHPELDMFDEYYAVASNYELPVKPIEELNDGEGMILMFNHMVTKELMDDVEALDKRIYLYRENVRNQAKSHLKIDRGGTTHAKEEVDQQFNLSEHDIVSRVEDIQRNRQELRRLLPDDTFWITYEDITGGEHIESTELPGLCDYLGIESQTLNTNLQKINADSDSS